MTDLDQVKPPLGIAPKHIWVELRVQDLFSAITRYRDAGLEPLPEWDVELQEHRVTLQQLATQQPLAARF